MKRFGITTTIILLLLMLARISFAESLEQEYKPTREEWLELKVASYVNGFKEFDTKIEVVKKSVIVSIFYDYEKQSKSEADKLKRKLETEIPDLYREYDWAEKVKLVINLYGVGGNEYAPSKYH
ncbi:MAG: hypothetical protein ABID09_00605 [Candidatus Omnitrophota bacterium]